jgi:hypothetical protein
MMMAISRDAWDHQAAGVRPLSNLVLLHSRIRAQRYRQRPGQAVAPAMKQTITTKVEGRSAEQEQARRG